MPKKRKTLQNVWSTEVIHIKLMVRLILLGILSLVFGFLTIWKIAFQGLNPFWSIFIAVIGFLLGYYVFCRTNVIVWDEEKEMVSVGKMDIFGAIVFACYFIFEFLIRIVLIDRFGAATVVTGLTLATFFGIFFGRLIGALVSVRKTHEENI